MRIPVIGLEIHSQLKTKTKMFCRSLNDPEEKHPNVNICPVCMGHPGTLPVMNKKAIESVIKTGLALNCKIAEHSKFDRKNYFYPDLPKGYQISQYDEPLCFKGYLDIAAADESLELENPKSEIRNPKQIQNLKSQNSKLKKVRITRIHLEEDTGRLIHNKIASLIDFNRAGVPLMELVTEPDISNAEEAAAFAKKLQVILQYLEVSDASMEKGQMRVEVNISLQRKSEIRNPKSEINPKIQILNSELGTKVEIKNLNSFAAVKESIEYEIKRQGQLLDKGEKIIQETRGWDENKKATVSQRLKEHAHDYRYFPEPDLLEVSISGKSCEGIADVIDLDAIQMSLPELSDQKIARFIQEFGVSEKDAEILVSTKQMAAFFEQTVSELMEWESGADKKSLVKLAVNYINTDLRGLMVEHSAEIGDILITPENFAELISMIYGNKISSAGAKVALAEMFATGKDPSAIVEEKGLAQVSDADQLGDMAREVIAGNQNAVVEYKGGKVNALQFLVGQMMARTKGKANPQVARELIERLIK